jgi:hypothetical protein
MKSLMLTLTLGLGALGLVAITPGEAKAWHSMGMWGGNWGGMWGSRGFGRVTQFNGTPTVSSTVNGSNVMLTIAFPSGVRSRLTQGGVAQLFFGPSTKTINFNNSTGAETVTNSSRLTQFVFTPYINIPRPFFSLGNRVLVNPISLGFGSSLNSFSGAVTTMPGQMFVVPFTNLATVTGSPTIFAMTNSGTDRSFSLIASGEPESETAAAYRDYVPPGFIK